MRRSVKPFIIPFILGVMVAGCTTPSGTEVTRFHLGQPIPADTIALVPAPGGDANSLEFRSQAAIVGRDLAAVGLQPADGTATAYIGVLRIEQSTRIGPPRSSPFRIGFGGSTGGFNRGVGAGVSLPLGGERTGEVRTNFLSLQIRRRSDSSMIWEGRAVQDIAADAPASALTTALPALSKALTAGFPGPNGQTVKVK